MGMWKWTLGTAGLLLLALLMGCLDFDEQTIYVEYDQENDRLLMIINYKGLYADGEDIPQAQEQLQEALENESVAFFGNWPFEFSLRELREELRHPDEEDKDDIPEEVRQDVLRLVERASVTNGGFYTDAAGRICGAQVLVIEQAVGSIQLVNRIINTALVEAEEEAPEDPEEELMRRLWLEHARKGHKWVALNGHSLVISIPLPEKLLKEHRRELVEDMFQDAGADMDLFLRQLREGLANPVLVWHENDLLKVKCGYVSEPSAFVTKLEAGEYRPNLVDHITEIYGLHLDANLACYLVEDAGAATEAELAARIMAPRLTKPERIRVLVHQLKTSPTEQYWAKLREDGQAELSNEELLQRWEQWLQEKAGVPGDEAQGQPQLAPAPAE